MRLLYTTGSPFARLVRIALLETGLDAGVTKQELTRAPLFRGVRRTGVEPGRPRADIGTG
jgi:hypothetical protein